jgi:hypothetical protein
MRIDLWSAPFRPGELPAPLRLELPDDLLEKAAGAAAKVSVPLGLWLRLTTEAARGREAVAAALNVAPEDVEAVLDEAARDSGVPGLSELERYAAGLSSPVAGAPPRSPASRQVEILVSLEIQLAWRLTAKAQGLELNQWVARSVAGASGEILRWEASAAARGMALGEWCYAAFLAARVRSSAVPQPRT